MYIGGKFFEIEMFSMNGNNWIREVINSKIWNSYDRKVFLLFFFFYFYARKKMWIEMFFIKFEGKIESFQATPKYKL